MTENQNDNPEILARAGATLEAFHAFARAAVRFYGSPVRQELFPTDLIRIEAPAAEPAFRYAVWVDLGSPRTGLIFFDSVEAWEEKASLDDSHAPWQVAFEPFLLVHPYRQELWDTHLSPHTADGRCPGLFQIRFLDEEEEDEDGEIFDEEEILADDSRLGFVEGLLLALAETTAAELDSGRWEKTVGTSRGETRFVLSLPDLVDPRPAPEPADPPADARLLERPLRDLHRHLEDQGFESVDEARAFLGTVDSLDQIPHPEPTTPEERAQELVDEALGSRDRRRAIFARRALEIWPDCAEAYVLLAEVRDDPEAAVDLFRQGIAAGERALGPVIEENAGELWTVLAARPYLRALNGLALALFGLGRLDESAEVAREMLRLDALDVSRMRHLLIAVSLRRGRPVEAWELLDRFGDDGPWACYTRALLTFGEQGNSKEARSWLRRGVEKNSLIGLCLLDMTVFPGQGLPHAMPIQIIAALAYADLYLDAWKAEPG
ncbi:MAG TPA: hypothetical protein VL025_04825, partial [Thermoanaerobaculia bacterium]|nr:hypothetical protein [Thermoanaerobaculia bacterium]